MEKEFVPYELAIKLKALGFNEPCIMQWHYANDMLFCKDIWGHPKYKTNLESKSDSSGDCISAPTFSQAFRWFREKHNCSHAINKTYGGQYIPYVNGEELDLDSELNEIEGYKWLYTSYEEAELACLTKLIEIVETKSA